MITWSGSIYADLAVEYAERVTIAECPSLQKCNFFSVKPEGKVQQVALGGFMSIYCRGEKQGQCMRRFVGRSLGGPDKIPRNMMPNGHPLTGTDDSGWPAEVKTLLAKKRALQ